MKGRKFLNVLLLRPAFTKGNVSAIGLVAIFFFTYTTLTGSKGTRPPNLRGGHTFGSVAVEDLQQEDLQGLGENGNDVAPEPVRNGEARVEAQSVIGVVPTDAEVARMKEIDSRGRLFDPNTPEGDGSDGPVNREGLVKGVEFRSHRDEWIMQRSEKRKSDGLAAIEDRLDMKRVRKKKFAVSTGDPN